MSYSSRSPNENVGVRVFPFLRKIRPIPTILVPRPERVQKHPAIPVHFSISPSILGR